MQRSELSKLVDSDFDKIKQIFKDKGHDYAGDEDALANFKIQAADWGLTPEQVWGVFFGKHMSAIKTFIREGDVQSEPIEGRIHDAILYLHLLHGLIVEKKSEQCSYCDEWFPKPVGLHHAESDCIDRARPIDDVLPAPPRSSSMSYTTPESDPHSPEFGRKA